MVAHRYTHGETTLEEPRCLAKTIVVLRSVQTRERRKSPNRMERGCAANEPIRWHERAALPMTRLRHGRNKQDDQPKCCRTPTLSKILPTRKYKHTHTHKSGPGAYYARWIRWYPMSASSSSSHSWCSVSIAGPPASPPIIQWGAQFWLHHDKGVMCTWEAGRIVEEWVPSVRKCNKRNS